MVLNLSGILTSTPVLILSTLILTLLPLLHYLDRRLFPAIAHEPPSYPSSLPILRNTLSYGQHAANFYQAARTRFGALVPYTAHIAGKKFHIITDPFQISHVLRQPGKFSFITPILGFMHGFMGVDVDTVALLRSQVDDPHAYVNATAAHSRAWIVTHATDGSMRRGFQGRLAAYLAAQPGERRTIPLRTWTGTLVAETNMPILYGEGSTYPELSDDFWNWADSMPLLMSPFPAWIVARKALAARTRIHEHLRKILKSDGMSDMIVYRMKSALEAGITYEGAASFEIGIITALLSNTIPAVYWMLLHTLEDAERLRAELMQGVEIVDGVAEISERHVLKDCPQLMNTWLETLRLYQNSAQMREVLEDGAEIPISKDKGAVMRFSSGSMLQFPFRLPHVETSVWGEDAAEFRASRWEGGVTKQAREMYRPFGGGQRMCPAKQYAEEEACLVAAAVLVGWEVETLGERPLAQLESLGLGVAHPVGDVEVAMRKVMDVRFVD